MAYKCLSCTRPPEYCDICTDYARPGPAGCPNDERICELARQGRTDDEIMSITGLSRITVCKARLRGGINYRKVKRPPDDVLRTLLDTHTAKAISEQLGVTAATVNWWKRKMGYSKADKYEYWRELYNEGLNDVQLASHVNVTPVTIWKWRQREGLPAQKKRC